MPSVTLLDIIMGHHSYTDVKQNISFTFQYTFYLWFQTIRLLNFKSFFKDLSYTITESVYLRIKFSCIFKFYFKIKNLLITSSFLFLIPMNDNFCCWHVKFSFCVCYLCFDNYLLKVEKLERNKFQQNVWIVNYHCKNKVHFINFQFDSKSLIDIPDDFFK